MTRYIPLIDLAFLWIERPETPSNVGIVLLFDPPEGCTASAEVSRVMRRFGEAQPTPPFDCIPEFPALGLPRWRKIDDWDTEHHLQREMLPGPGRLDQLWKVVADLHRDPLDRARPLFRLHFIEGLAGGQFAIYVKSHHASWDGRSALPRVFSALSQEPGRLREPFFAQPVAQSRDALGPMLPADLAAYGFKSVITQTLAVRELFTKLAAKASHRRQNGGRASGNRPFGGPHTRFNRPVERDRSFASFSLPLEDMREIARAFDAKINDVILSVVDAGVHRYLAQHGELPAEPIVAMVPVSLREEGDEEPTTKAANMFVPLGRPRSGATRRMEEVLNATRSAKAEFESLSNEAKLDYSLLAFGLWFGSHALGMDAFTRPVINLTVSNVGGLPGPRYLGGSRLAGAYPVSMLADPVGLNVTMLSVDGRMDFGLVANRPAVPDPGLLAEHCVAAFATLKKATRLRKKSGNNAIDTSELERRLARAAPARKKRRKTKRRVSS